MEVQTLQHFLFWWFQHNESIGPYFPVKAGGHQTMQW